MNSQNKNFAKTSESGKGSNSGNVSKPVKPEIRRPAKRYITAILGIVALLGLFLFPKIAAAKYAGLYILGDNGKKSGRESGSVAMRNGRNRQMAFFATTLNAFTSAAKAVFSAFNSAWRGLAESERLTWLGYETFTSDRFARPVKVSGKTAFVQLNVNIANSGGSIIAVAPSKSIPAPVYTALTSLTATASTGAISIAYVMNAAGTTTFIWATKPLSAGVSKPSKSAFRLVSIGDTSAASPLSFGADYSGRFGNITGNAGDKIFIRTVVVDNATGLTSIAAEVSTIIVP